MRQYTEEWISDCANSSNYSLYLFPSHTSVPITQNKINLSVFKLFYVTPYFYICVAYTRSYLVLYKTNYIYIHYMR